MSYDGISEDGGNSTNGKFYIQIGMMLGIVIVVVVTMLWIALDHNHRIDRCMELEGWKQRCDEYHKLQPGFDCMTPLSELELTRDDSPWARRICVELVAGGWNEETG